MPKPALQFSLPDHTGKTHSLADYAGKWLLIYFYPKDDTPGCTTEACNFRDNWDQLQDLGVAILGVSKDSQQSHQKFADKYQLPFPLLIDQESTLAKELGAFGEKKMFGKTYMGIKRQSFLINPEGQIVKEYLKVKPASHAQEVITDLRELQDIN